ncbi:MAG: hypothetical protein U9Q77_08560 [Candidatus Marinimicrobia bacterium]|nr:hypothetical protein [Candidatus Neomarinimicrobiota bacterium]
MRSKPLSTFIFLIMALSAGLQASTLQIKPYAQWTFDSQLEAVYFRPDGTGFPIELVLTNTEIVYYDSTGNQVRKIARTPGDRFVMDPLQHGFMLIQENPSIRIDRQERLYSFQMFNEKGEADYTIVHAVDLMEGQLSYQITGHRNILLTEKGQPWVLELNAEDTLLHINSCRSGVAKEGTSYTLATKLYSRHAMVTAVSCLESGQRDSSTIELRLWEDEHVILDPVLFRGTLAGMQPLPATDYYFLEIDRGGETELTLFNRLDSLKTYPWKSWKIGLLGQKAAFVITEKDLKIVNLGDGTVAASYHPIDLSSISDAVYLQEWGLFLYLRYESFFREDGRQAFRNFELEGVNKSGRIVHRSSFGTWTYSLPKLTQLGSDLFAVHIYNAVLLYRIDLERN